MRCKFLGLAAVLSAALSGPAFAVSVQVTTFSPSAYAAELGNLEIVRAQETFEGVATGEKSGPLSTAVGFFETLGGVGSGGTVSGTPGNTGTGLFVRDTPTFGRKNTTPGGSVFLDSNDTFGMRWTVGGVGLFDSLLFSLSDVGDSGGNLSIAADGVVMRTILKGRSGSLTDLVLISFGDFVDTATITLEKDKLNDGFAIDDVVVGASVAPVPLPPAGLALLAGLGALAVVRRRRAASA
jgi:hypothetical protein